MFSYNSYKCVIFDLDGTLAYTLDDIALSMNKALQQNNFAPSSIERYRNAVGNGITNLAKSLLPPGCRPETVERVAEEAKAFYAEQPVVSSKPYPGVIEMLNKLKRKKIKTAVISNKPDDVTQTVIASLFEVKLFDVVQGALPRTPLKPSPVAVFDILQSLGRIPPDTIFAGDSEVDIKCALNCGAYPLGCSWGYRDKELLLKSGAAKVIDNPAEILDFF